MRLESLVEVLSAAHMTSEILSPFPQRGGIMLVAPPAALKTTIIRAAIDTYPDSLVLSDINVQQLVRMRDDLCGKYRTLAFTELEKLYQRNPDTAANIEGHLKALVEEGFGTASFEDQRISLVSARVLVVGALTPAMERMRFSAWMDNGFARRFLWCHYALDNPRIIINAISEWKRITIDNGYVYPLNGLSEIKYEISRDEDRAIQVAIKHQPGQETPLVLMKKILCVLRWKYRAMRIRQPDVRALAVLMDFGTSLGQRGTTLVINNGTGR